MRRYLEGIRMSELYKRLGWTGGKIPRDVCFQSKVQVPLRDGTECLMEVIVNPGPPAAHNFKSSAHRVFVKCPTCGSFVPAGRLHQHEGTKTCRTKGRMLLLDWPEIPPGDVDHDDEDRRAYREELNRGSIRPSEF